MMAGFRCSLEGDRGRTWAAYSGESARRASVPAGPKETRITARVVMARVGCPASRQPRPGALTDFRFGDSQALRRVPSLSASPSRTRGRSSRSSGWVGPVVAPFSHHHEKVCKEAVA